MNRTTANALVLAGFVGAGVCIGAARAADAPWHDVAANASTTTLALKGVQPQADGTVLVNAVSSPFESWYLLLDASMQVIDHAYGGPPVPLPLGAAAGDGTVAVFPFFNDGIVTPAPSRVCWMFRNAVGGLDVRMAHDTIAPHADFPSQVRRLDADGTHYGIGFGLDTGPLLGLQRDCNLFGVPAPPFGVVDVAPIPNVSGAYAVIADDESEERTRTLERVREGALVWARSLGATGATPVLTMLVASDGDALLLQSTDSAAVQPRSVVSRFDLDGELLWSRAYEAQPFPRALIGDGERTVVVSASTTCGPAPQVQVAAYDAGGNEIWRESLAACWASALYDARHERTPLLGDSAGNVFAITPTGLSRVAEGAPGRTPLARTADGSILFANGDIDGMNATLAYQAPGEPLRDIELRVPAQLTPKTVLHDALGAFVVLQPAASDTVVAHYSPTGEKRWERTLGSAPPPHTNAAYQLAANTGRLCVWMQLDYPAASQLTCLNRDDGSIAMPWTDAPHRYIGAASSLEIGADGSVDALGTSCFFEPPATTCGYRVRRLKLKADGQLERLDTYGSGTANDSFAYGIASPTSDDIAVFHPSPDGTRLDVFDAAGVWRWGKLSESSPTIPLAFRPDGSLLARAGDRFDLYDATGTLRWSYELPPSAALAASDVDAVALPSGQFFVLGNSWPGKRFRALLRAADGVPAWQIADTVQSRYDSLAASLKVSSGGSHVFLVPEWEPEQRMLAFSMSDGAIVGAAARNTPPALATGATAASVAQDGSMVFAQAAPSAGRVDIEYRPASLQIASTTPVASDALAGAWHATDASGQGFFLTQQPGLVSGAWFTYTGQGGHAASEQRWYTLVGATTQGAPATSLKIYRSAPGVFASAPGVAATQVGEAQLVALACDRALLTYAFDTGEQNARRGAIPLTRSLPSGATCGATASASSGAWYDPAATGQGLVFELRAAQDDAPASFTGGWFTFDAEPQAGDDSRLHWFTLAAPLASANGSVKVPIYRTVGGRLDAEPTNNTWPVGEATLNFDGCDRATLAYTFVDDRIAHGFRGKHGTLQLQRVAACTSDRSGASGAR